MPARLALGSEAVRLLRQAARLSRGPVYLVGGALRDCLLGRPTLDLDLAAEDARGLARDFSRAAGRTLVVLDEETAVYRVVLGLAESGSVRQVDIAAIQGRGIGEDLMRRDFTINSLALPLSPTMADRTALEGLLDPRGGLADLKGRRVRAESERLFKDDPLRLLRAFRIAAQLDFEIEAKTLGMVKRLRHRVNAPAGERLQAELLALLALPGASRWLKAMDECGLLTALFEDLEPARQCALVYYGPGGVLTHSLDTAARADFLLSHLAKVFPRLAGRIEARLDASSHGGAPQRSILMLAALLHDVAKPETAKSVDGRLRFFGHDALGARRAAAILKRLRFSRGHMETVSAVIANHLRPGNLAAAELITDKAAYRFFRDLGEHALSLLLVCWADHASYLPQASLLKHLKTASREPDGGSSLSRVRPEAARKTIYHLQVISYLIRRLFAEKKAVPDRVIDGHEVMKALGLKPGPKVGAWLERVREAQAEGRIKTKQDALDFLLKAQ